MHDVRPGRSTYDRQRLADHVQELRILAPALSEALERDQGAPTGERVSSSAGLALPINADVLQALRTLNRGLPAVTQRAAEVLGEAFVARDIAGHLRHLARLHERLLAVAAVDEAVRLVVGVDAVLFAVKLAIGLRLPDRPIGHDCPMHDQDRTELVKPGDIGYLRYDRLVAGVPVAPTVTWVPADVVLCRTCAGSWVPAQYDLLSRMIGEALQRRQGGAA